jgi:solute carrier family 5 (sodium-coupled monocarboxylate transporter), member 8/12
MILNTNQTCLQRILALKDVKTARTGLLLYVVGITILISMCIFNGLLAYAIFHDCDPLTTKLAKAKDQIVPLLVMTILKDVPGLPGLFIAGVFSGKNFFITIISANLPQILAALSSLSSGLNSMSAIVLEDYFKPVFGDQLSDRASGFIMRGTVLVLGILSVGLVYVVQHLGPVLQLSMSIPATCVGSLFGVFSIGMFLPWIGKRATFYGALIASSIMIYCVVRAQLDIANGLIHFDTKPTSVEGCSYNFTSTYDPKHVDKAQERQFHQISYLYYMPLGAIIACVSAFLLSFVFGFEDPNNVDPRLLAPVMRKYFNSKVERSIKQDFDGIEETLRFEMKNNQID